MREQQESASRRSMGESVNRWRTKEARNRAIFREVNERIDDVGGSFDRDGLGSFVCECGNADCMQAIELSHTEYECVRVHGNRFVVALNHENPELESLVEQNGRFAVVETSAGEASRIARESDPRSQRATFRCSTCGYGAVARAAPERCPLCGGSTWEFAPWRPFTRLLDQTDRPASRERPR